GYNDCFMVRFDSAGSVLWAKDVGGALNESCGGICINKSGDCFITGYSGSTNIGFDSIYLSNTGNIFVALLKNINPPTGNVPIYDTISSSIYPNPFSDETIISTDRSFKDATLAIYNSFGEKVKQINNISGETIMLFRDHLPGGLYFIQLTK